MVLLGCESSFPMPLHASGPLKESQKSWLLEVFHGQWKNLTDFRNSAAVEFKSSQDLLYIHQGEMVTVRYSSSVSSGATSRCKWIKIGPSLPRYVGTGEMTSCHAVLVTSSSGYVFGHLDGSCEGRLTEQFFQTVTQFFEDDDVLDVHVVGGFQDDRNYSMGLSWQIISQLISSERTFDLKTLCTWYLNDSIVQKNGSIIHMPTVRAVVFDCQSGALEPASFSLDAQGPLNVLRHAYTWSNLSRRQMHNVWDPNLNRLVLKPFIVFEPRTMTAFAYISKCLTDKELEIFSTTPLQEIEQFYQLLREVSALVIDLTKYRIDLFSEGNLELALDEVTKNWSPVNSQTVRAVKYPRTSLKSSS